MLLNMFLNAEKLLKIFYFYIIKLLLLLPIENSQASVNFAINAMANPATTTSDFITSVSTKSSRDYTNNLINILRQCESSDKFSTAMVFCFLISQFLIKEHVRFYEPTRYEEQLHANLLQHFGNLLNKTNNNNNKELITNSKPNQRKILNNIFQHDVLINQPRIKSGHIDTFIEFGSLRRDYGNLVNIGFPNGGTSDFCLANVSSSRSDACHIEKRCLDVIFSDLPTYGYHRTHQILLLYIFMHHKCSQIFGSTATYEMLASQHCSQVYREQNVIKSLGIPDEYKDLYVEQTLVCGLLGFAEFLNWRFVDLMLSWPHAGDCLCQYDDKSVTQYDCSCTNHINSLAIAYLTNAILLLN